MATTHASILSDWKKGKFDPIYLLYGEEDFFIDDLVSFAERQILNEGEQAFNQIVLYGKEIGYQNILDNAYQFPMMSDKRVVIVKEFQEMRDVDGLAPYFENPAEQTVLVLAYKHKKFDKRKKIWKTAVAKSTSFESKKIYDNKIPAFISKQLKSMGIDIEPQASDMMATYLGNDLSKVMNEINKLSIIKTKGSQVTKDDVHEQIGISKEFNVFEFQKALGAKDQLASYRIANYFGENAKKVNIVPILGSLIGFYQKIAIAKVNPHAKSSDLAPLLGVSPYFVQQYTQAARKYSGNQIRNAFKVLKEIDLKSKGVGTVSTPQGQLLKELVYGLLK